MAVILFSKKIDFIEKYTWVKDLFYWNKLQKVQNSKLFANCHVSLDTLYLMIYNTRLLGRFALIFYFNCEQFSLCIQCITKQNFSDLKKKSFQKSNFVPGKFFFNSIIHKPFLGSREVSQKIWAQTVKPFWRLLDANKQTNKQTNKCVLPICVLWSLWHI